MQKTFAFQEPNLFRCGKSFLLALAQPFQNQRRFAGIAYIVGIDSEMFQACNLLLRRRSHFPSERWYIVRQVFRLDGHFELNRVYQLLLAFLHFLQMFGK